MNRRIFSIAIAGTLCNFSYAASVSLSLSESSAVTVYTLATKAKRTLQPGSVEHAQLAAWLVANQRGWSPYLATPPAKGVIIQAPGLKLQIISTSVLAYTAQGIASKTVGTSDLSFITQ